jgi:hypothetical protein
MGTTNRERKAKYNAKKRAERLRLRGISQELAHVPNVVPLRPEAHVKVIVPTRDEVLATMALIMRDEEVQAACRVSAGKALLEHLPEDDAQAELDRKLSELSVDELRRIAGESA